MTIDIKRELSIVTIFTAVAYLSGYFYQYGFFVYFSAPRDLISVDINTLLFSAVVVAFFLYVIFGPSLIYNDIFNDKDSTNKQTICNTLAFYIFFSFIYSFAFFAIQKMDPSTNRFYSLSLIMKSLSFSLIFNALVVVLTFYLSKLTSDIIKHPWKKTKIYIALNISPIVLAMAFLGGFQYAKIGVADYYYGSDGYFMVTENSKGVLVAKCDVNDGVVFKRLESSFSDIKINNNIKQKDEIRKCLANWRKK